MSEPTRTGGEHASRVQEFSAAVRNFDVVDRNGETIGRVQYVNLERTCVVVETGRGLFARKQRHALHVWAVREIDAHRSKIFLAATKEDVAEAPELRELDGESETALARYYYDRLAALGETVDAGDG